MNNISKQTRQIIIWCGALAIGAAIGLTGCGFINDTMNFVATIYTRLFQLLAVPTIALAIVTTLSSLGGRQDTGRIFRHALAYTLLTTTVAAAVALALYCIVQPDLLPQTLVG